MNLLKKLLCVGALSLSLTGCMEQQYENSINHIKTRVTHKDYTSEVKIMGLGIDWELNLVLEEKTIPERYDITFFGDQMEFKVNDKKLFDRFELNDTADVSYRESRMLTYYDLDKDGKKELIQNEIIQNKFIDAERLK